MDTITTFSTQKIIRQNKCKMRFLDKLAPKQDFDQKLMINTIYFSILDSPSTSDYDEMENGVSKSTFLRTYNKKINERNKTLPWGSM